MDYIKLLADRTHGMETSAIREILKVVNQPGMISLAGGIPAPESFDIEVLDKLHREITLKYGAELLSKGKLGKQTACMGSKRLADLYGLEIVDSNLQDDPSNTTNFLLVR